MVRPRGLIAVADTTRSYSFFFFSSSMIDAQASIIGHQSFLLNHHHPSRGRGEPEKQNDISTKKK
jgi:hypothetical protein